MPQCFPAEGAEAAVDSDPVADSAEVDSADSAEEDLAEAVPAEAGKYFGLLFKIPISGSSLKIDEGCRFIIKSIIVTYQYVIVSSLSIENFQKRGLS